MKCIYHTDRQAISICAYCGRGLCEECAVDVEEHVVCADHCEDLMRQRLELERRNRQLTAKLEDHMSKSLRSGRILAMAWLIIGLLLLLLAWGAEGVQPTLMLALPGLAGVVAGVASLMVWRKD